MILSLKVDFADLGECRGRGYQVCKPQRQIRPFDTALPSKPVELQSLSHLLPFYGHYASKPVFHIFSPPRSLSKTNLDQTSNLYTPCNRVLIQGDKQQNCWVETSALRVPCYLTLGKLTDLNLEEPPNSHLWTREGQQRIPLTVLCKSQTRSHR